MHNSSTKKRTRCKNGTRKNKKTGKCEKVLVKKSKSKSPELPLCAICHEDLKINDDIPDLPCKHKFHQACIIELCNHKNNRQVSCPICRNDITQTCTTINPITPFVNKYLDVGEYGAPVYDWASMSVEQRKEADKIVTKFKKNFMARRKRAMAKETTQQLAQRRQIEQDYQDRIYEERYRLFHFNG